MTDNRTMNCRLSGFTLAELLIALLILGVIATFTIPKVLNAQQGGKDKAVAKEVAAMISGAYEAYKFENGQSGTIGAASLTPYMNYVRFTTSGLTLDDDPPGVSPVACSEANRACLFLHSGAGVYYPTDSNFGGTATNNGIWFHVDIDGGVNQPASNGTGKSIVFVLFYNGRIQTRGTIAANACNSVFCLTPGTDPSWFDWD